jgi:hypothetical protein
MTHRQNGPSTREQENKGPPIADEADPRSSVKGEEGTIERLAQSRACITFFFRGRDESIRFFHSDASRTDPVVSRLPAPTSQEGRRPTTTTKKKKVVVVAIFMVDGRSVLLL